MSGEHTPEKGQSKSVGTGDGSASWVVSGYALVPVKIEIMVNAPTGSIAGKAAEKIWHNSKNKRAFIVPDTADESSVCDFRWSEVQPNT